MPVWNWFNCYLSGRHKYGVWCEPGAIFLRCLHCGRRSSGWTVEGKPKTREPVVRKSPPISAGVMAGAHVSRVVPFERHASAR